MLNHRFSRKDGGGVLTLGGELTIYTASEAFQLLQGHLGSVPRLDLDLSGIEEFDTAGAQLLFWAKREAHHLGKDLAIIHHGPSVVNALDLLNLASVLGDAILEEPGHGSR